MNAEHLAKEAERLTNDDVLNFAISQISRDALLELRDCNPDEMTRIIQLQEKAKLCEEFVQMLHGYITAMGDLASDGPANPY